MKLHQENFNIYGDNIVECDRTLDYIIEGLGELVLELNGPLAPVTCPVYVLKLTDRELTFQFLPGYGERRWNQDVLGFIKRSGGRLREAADAILTRINDDGEQPIAAIEYCGALPAGNQAWQRQGRAFSFAHARIPFFYVAELGGFELAEDRKRKAERMPNPALPFSFFAMTHYQGSICLPVYEANPGATKATISQYEPIFGKQELLEFLRVSILNGDTGDVPARLSQKCVALVELLAGSKKRQDGLTGSQWKVARDLIKANQNLPDFLAEQAPLSWRKIAYIAGLTDTARKFMTLCAKESLGLTSSTLPLSFVPKDRRAAFAEKAKAVYPDMNENFAKWMANENTHLAIAWVMGFKPRGDDARPDRGLPPLARMLVGDGCEVMTFVYGPAPVTHWSALATKPTALAASNGLWEAVLGVSDGVLVDSATKPPSTPRGHLKDKWQAVLKEEKLPLSVEPHVLSLGEQDVDTALHVAFESLGADIVFEGMCNPPGGDWSGISFKWASKDPEHRWLSLKRVSGKDAKRPDHVFALFGHQKQTICLCIESKERAKSLEPSIGPRLKRFTEILFEGSPSIYRPQKESSWTIHDTTWKRKEMLYVSAGAYLSTSNDPHKGLPANTNLDFHIGVAFSEEAKHCTLHLRGETDLGRALVSHLAGLEGWGKFISISVSN